MSNRKYPRRPWVSAHGIIFDKKREKILLTKRAAPPKALFWFPPGGAIDLGETVKEGLRRVVNAKHGTGFYARSKDIIVSGKTGTAQNPQGKPHAWFAGFAPFESPKISIVVFVEHGGKGGLEPARFAKKIIEKAKKLELL